MFLFCNYFSDQIFPYLAAIRQAISKALVAYYQKCEYGSGIIWFHCFFSPILSGRQIIVILKWEVKPTDIPWF